MHDKTLVLMPVYNAEEHIDEALESVLNQTFSDFELLVLDDGSTDGTSTLLHYAALDPRVKLFKSAHQEVANCLNQLVSFAMANTSRMDGDDICRPTRLKAT